MVNCVPTILDSSVPATPPVIAPAGLLTGIPHEYVVPTGTIPLVPSCGSTVVKVSSLHIVWATSLICGSGFTVMVIVKSSPTQPSAVDGVTV